MKIDNLKRTVKILMKKAGISSHNELAAIITENRKAKGITTKTNFSSISHILSDGNPRVKTITEFAEALGVSYDDFLRAAGA